MFTHLIQPIRNVLCVVVTGLCLGCTLSSAYAQELDPLSPKETVDAFHQALMDGDRAKAENLLDEDVLIFESGSVQRSRSEYAAHHLSADIEAAQALDRKFVYRNIVDDGYIAWVSTVSRSTGNYKGRERDSTGLETMVLRRTENGWRITHIHWSSKSNN